MLNKAIYPKASTVFVLVFALLLTGSALLSEFFQSPGVSLGELQLTNPVQHQGLKNLTKIEIKNRLETFELAPSGQKNEQEWRLTHPKQLPANMATIDKILDSLRNIKVKKLYPKDPINLSNFSLDHPISRIKLVEGDQAETTISFGIINPIDNTTYISFDDKDYIYKIERPEHLIQSFDLASYVDSSLFSSLSDNINKISIYRGKIEKNLKQLIMSKSDSDWTDSKNRKLSEEKVQSHLKSLLNVKGVMILDKQTPSLEKGLDKYFKYPLYTVYVYEKDKKNPITYEISPLISSLPDINIEKKKNVVVRASNRNHPYLLDKSILKLLEIRENQLIENRFKKLFY